MRKRKTKKKKTKVLKPKYNYITGYSKTFVPIKLWFEDVDLIVLRKLNEQLSEIFKEKDKLSKKFKKRKGGK